MSMKLKHVLASTQCENCGKLFEDCGHISDRGAFFYRGTVKTFTRSELLTGKCKGRVEWGREELED